MASGAASSKPRNLASTRLRSVMSRMAAVTSMPSSVSSGPEADLGGELGAVLAQRRTARARAHRARDWLGEVPGAMCRMLVAEAVWNQDLDRLPHQLRPLVAEQLAPPDH